MVVRTICPVPVIERHGLPPKAQSLAASTIRGVTGSAGQRKSHLGAVLSVREQMNLRSIKAAMAFLQAHHSEDPTSEALAAAVAPRYGSVSRRAGEAGPHQGGHGHAVLSTLDHLLADARDPARCAPPGCQSSCGRALRMASLAQSAYASHA